MTNPDLLAHLRAIRAFAAHPTLLPPVDALAAHAHREFKLAGVPIPQPPVLRQAAETALEEMRPHLRAALYTHEPAHGPYLPGGGGKWKPSFERASEPAEKRHARAVHAARVRWEKEAGLVVNGHRPVSVTAVLHRPPGTGGRVIGYPHGLFGVYGPHLAVLPHPARWYPGDTHNLKVFDRLHPMTHDHAVVMAATQGVEEDPLEAGLPGGSEYPEGLILGGLDLSQYPVHRYHVRDREMQPRQWHPSHPLGMTYGAWRVLKAAGRKP